MKKLFCIFFCIILVVATWLTIKIHVRDGIDLNGYVFISNIEALSNGESMHIWCCGTKDVCIKADGVEIVGRKSVLPCW